jgi:hypothetical protein
MISRGALVVAMLSALLFGATVGLIGGVAFSHLMHGHGGQREFFRMGMRGHRPMPMPGLMMQHLERELKLTDPQHHAIESVLERSRTEFEAVRESTHARIDRVLTPEQTERWHQMERRPPGMDVKPPSDPRDKERR